MVKEIPIETLKRQAYVPPLSACLNRYYATNMDMYRHKHLVKLHSYLNKFRYFVYRSKLSRMAIRSRYNYIFPINVNLVKVIQTDEKTIL